MALAALDAVLGHGHPLDRTLEQDPHAQGLPERDRGFVQMLLLTTLRRLGQIDDALARLIERPIPPKRLAVQHILRLGACQLLFLGTPAHAAVSTAVALADHARERAHKGLINAVLRRLAAEGPAIVAGGDAPRLNTPAWLWESWGRSYGEETTRQIAEAHLAEASLDISVKTDAEGWARRLGAELLPTGSLRLYASGSVAKLPGYDEGAWWVQDAAAALPAALLGDVRGRRIIDLCAAPGGKTAQLAAAGAHVTAVDRSEQRLRRLADNMKRLELRVETVAADAGRWKPAVPADAVLLDAPCSATGTIRRHPDVAWTKDPASVQALAQEQDRLLRAAIGMVRPGGLLVYAACSLQPEEGAERIAALLASTGEVARVPLAASDVRGHGDLISAAGDLRTLPCHLGDRGGMDGFFAARLRRR